MMARKRQRSNNDDATRKQLLDLPVDTLVDILLRLPAMSVGRIKCVCKTLLNMVNNISFSTLHTRSHSFDQVPRLMCCCSDIPLLTLQSLKYKDNTLTEDKQAITISSSTYYPLCFVFCNLFYLGFNNGDSMLVNCLGERELLRLPKASFAARSKDDFIFGIGFDDKTNTYKIVCVSSYDRDKSMTTHVLVLGTNSWRQISSLPPCELSCIDDKPVCTNGAVYWWTWNRVKATRRYDGTRIVDRRVVSFDFRREEFCWTATPPALAMLESNISMFSLRGCLAIAETKLPRVGVRTGVVTLMEVWVLKGFDEKQWVRCYYTNKLPDSFPFEFDGSAGEWEHGIFFTDDNSSETTFFFIDLRFGSINSVKYICSARSFPLAIYSYSETLISLKDYGDLEEAHQMMLLTW